MRLRGAGLVWRPGPGDRFVVPNNEMDDEVFVLSTMTVEVHELPTGPVIGFNGTTEWALDDVDAERTIWLPREDQLRMLLGAAFERLERAGSGWRVVATVAGEPVEFTADDAETAYALTLLHRLTVASPASRRGWG